MYILLILKELKKREEEIPLSGNLLNNDNSNDICIVS